MSCNRRNKTAPCMFNFDELVGSFNGYRGGRPLLEAELSDLVCREAPRLIAYLEEYPEAGQTGLRITRLRLHQVRGQGSPPPWRPIQLKPLIRRKECQNWIRSISLRRSFRTLDGKSIHLGRKRAFRISCEVAW